MYLKIPYEADYFVLKITKIGDMHIFEVMFIIWRCCNYKLRNIMDRKRPPIL
jgi:hypothetical protein